MPTSLRATLLWLAAFMLAACNQSPAPQVTDPATLQPQAVTGGEVVAWGLNDFGQTDVRPFPGLSYTAIAAGQG